MYNKSQKKLSNDISNPVQTILSGKAVVPILIVPVTGAVNLENVAVFFLETGETLRE